jgi:K+-sensing histidine kinase KdpD
MNGSQVTQKALLTLSFLNEKKATIFSYTFALITTVIAFFIKVTFPVVGEDSPFLLLFTIIMLNAWYGGFGPGLLATFLAGIIAYLSFLKPIGLQWDIEKIIQILVFISEGIFISLLSYRYSAAEKFREKQEEHNRYLVKFSKNLASLDYEIRLNNIIRFLVPHFADWCVMIVVDKDGATHSVKALHKDAAKESLIQELKEYLKTHRTPFAEKVIQTGKSEYHPVIDESFCKKLLPHEVEFINQLGVKSHIAIPLQARNRNVGVICLFSSRHTYNRANVALLEEIGRRSGTAIDNSILYEKAQEAVRLRDEFLSIASHELKTPLTSVLLNLQSILRKFHKESFATFSPQQIMKMIESATKHSERLTILINELLDVSRIAAGKLTLMKEQMNLSDTVKEVLGRFNKELELSHSKVITQLDTTVVGNWDKLRIEQVVTNLLSNAIKYGNGKAIDIKIFKKNREAYLTVTDDGIGIDPKNVAKIFDRFERAVTSENYEGLGMGLYITKQIIESHDGTISVTSKPNDGSTFTVMLPM